MNKYIVAVALALVLSTAAFASAWAAFICTKDGVQGICSGPTGKTFTPKSTERIGSRIINSVVQQNVLDARQGHFREYIMNGYRLPTDFNAVAAGFTSVAEANQVYGQAINVIKLRLKFMVDNIRPQGGGQSRSPEIEQAIKDVAEYFAFLVKPPGGAAGPGGFGDLPLFLTAREQAFLDQQNRAFKPGDPCGLGGLWDGTKCNYPAVLTPR